MFTTSEIVVKELHINHVGCRFCSWRINAAILREKTYLFLSGSDDGSNYYMVNSLGDYSEFFLDVNSRCVDNEVPDYARQIENCVRELESFISNINKSDRLPIDRMSFLTKVYSSAITDSSEGLDNKVDILPVGESAPAYISYSRIKVVEDEDNENAVEYVGDKEESDNNTDANDCVGVEMPE